MDKKEMLKSMMSLKSKLMATVSMLLVSAILLSNVTYAWFVLSTAPEVSGVTTTSGANGALEIALQSNTTSDAGTATRLDSITSGVGDSSSLKTQTTAAANITWGNIVDVSSDYGLKDITLYPSRLNLGDNNTVNRLNYLSVPQYGTDGRISDFKMSDKVSYSDGSYVANPNNYGVNIHGFPATAEQEVIVSNYQREVVRQEAVKQVYTLRTSLREEMINVIEENGHGIIGLMFATLSEHKRNMTLEEAGMVEDLILRLDEIVTDSIMGLRWALLANVMSDGSYDPENADHMKELGVIYSDFLNMDLSSTDADKMTIKSIAESKGYHGLSEAVTTMEAVQDMMTDAKAKLEDGEYAEAGLKIVSSSHMYLMCGGQTPRSVIAGFKYNIYEAEETITEDDLYFVGGSESAVRGGVFPAMASILGDYEATMDAYVEIVPIEDTYAFYAYPTAQSGESVLFTYHTFATSKSEVSDYSEETNTGVLMAVYKEANSVTASGVISMETTRGDVTAYGYSVDLAFRSSEDGNLALQQEGTSRVDNPYDDPNNLNQNLQGGGSMVEFEIYGNMTVDQIKRLLQSLYVVFMDTDSGQIHCVGRVNPDDVEYLGVSVRAPLSLYSVDLKAMNDEDAEKGVLILGDQIKNNVITKLKANETEWITAIVYLNGDTVSSADVSAVGQMSLIGSINLQFALDGVTLEAMRYDDYYTAPSESEGE